MLMGEVEVPDGGGHNELRLRRMHFYVRHGFVLEPVRSRVYGVTYRVISYARPASMTADDVCAALRAIYEELLAGRLRMRLHVHHLAAGARILSCAALCKACAGRPWCKRLGHKNARPHFVHWEYARPACARGRLSRGQAALCRRCGNPFFQVFFHSLTMAGRSFPACRHRKGAAGCLAALKYLAWFSNKRSVGVMLCHLC